MGNRALDVAAILAALVARAGGGEMTSQISRIAHLRNFGVFRDFKCSANSLEDFKRFNLIYGWNGSGKTLLSRLFAGLQHGECPDECESTRIEFSGMSPVTKENFGTAGLEDRVRVFNKEFVDSNVFPAEGPVGPIFVLGEESREKQEELDGLKPKIDEKAEALQKLETLRKRLKTTWDDFGSEAARLIRVTLRSSGADDKYAHYERPEFFKRADSLLAQGTLAEILEQEERDRLVEFVRANPPSALQPLSLLFGAAAALFEDAKTLCERSVVSTAIQELRDRPDVNAWADEGLRLHHKHDTKTCLFCNQPLPAARLAALEAHFNEEYAKLVKAIDEQIDKTKSALEEAKAASPPAENELYPDLRKSYAELSSAFEDLRELYQEALQTLIEDLEKKRTDPFATHGAQVAPAGLQDKKVVALNEVIKAHNQQVRNHEEGVGKAKERIEISLVAEKIPKYTRIRKDIENCESKIIGTEDELKAFVEKQGELERDLIQHRGPAEDLNKDLANYLGHREIRFEMAEGETGYRVSRGGAPAGELSEGEKTAIALLYFLKSLEDKSFIIEEGIVVIDDPISSLDANSLYCAFGFLKDRAGKAGQLFVLTHNFLFFRQVKNWFDYLRKQGVSYYMLEAKSGANGRASTLLELDPLLREYESEYHYLFWLVYKASSGDGSEDGLEHFHYLPNVVRRLLEAFLEFKVPGAESLHARLLEVDFDEVTKARVYRFCNAHSHSKTVGAQESDSSVLGEARSVARDVMDIIKKSDGKHFERMTALVTAGRASTP